MFVPRGVLGFSSLVFPVMFFVGFCKCTTIQTEIYGEPALKGSRDFSPPGIILIQLVWEL